MPATSCNLSQCLASTSDCSSNFELQSPVMSFGIPFTLHLSSNIFLLPIVYTRHSPLVAWMTSRVDYKTCLPSFPLLALLLRTQAPTDASVSPLGGILPSYWSRNPSSLFLLHPALLPSSKKTKPPGLRPLGTDTWILFFWKSEWESRPLDLPDPSPGLPRNPVGSLSKKQPLYLN